MEIGSGNIKVVVADDSVLVRQHLVSMLRDLNHVEVVAEAADVPSVLEQVDQLNPEVVVLDIQMPGGTGIRALRKIKQTHPETLVIMLTNHADPFYRSMCLRSGANYFFDKSVEFEQVGHVLNTMLSAAS